MMLIITEQNTQSTDLILVEKLPENINTENGTFHFSINEKPGQLSTSADIAQIDFDTINLPLTLRRWRIGDYFYPLGMGMKKKKVSRFLIDQKIPIHQKEQLWILENNKQIVWIAGMRIDERFKIKLDTKKVIQIQFLQQ